MRSRRLHPLAMTVAVLVFAGCGTNTPRTSAEQVNSASDETASDTRFEAPVVESGEPTPPLTEAEKSVECRYERVTGSHMMRKVCRTAAERRRDEEASKQWMRTGGRSGGVTRVRDTADPRDEDDER